LVTAKPHPAPTDYRETDPYSVQNKEESVRNKVQASLQRGLEEEIAAEDR